MSTPEAQRPPIDLTVRAELDGWPCDLHFTLPAEKVRAALARLVELGYSPRAAAPAQAAPAPRPESPPTCPVHGTVKVKPSNHGGYFCAAKLPDGSYCKETPC
jgi:hypothetical protein